MCYSVPWLLRSLNRSRVRNCITCVHSHAQVHSDEEVRVLFRAVAGEVPGSPIFAMKLAPTSRHLEVRHCCCV
jgi:hypothetical protein